MKITMEVNDIDYGALAEQILPLVGDKLAEKEGVKNTILARFLSMPPSVAKSMINLMPDSKKDKLAVSLINKNKDVIIERITETAVEKGVYFNISNFIAEE